MSGIPSPGVEVIQEFQVTAPTIVQPTLMPCNVGAAYEVIEALNTDGTLNSDAEYGDYAQIPLTIPQSEFPSPRGNIDEVDVLEEEIETFLDFSGQLLQLPIRPFGDAFLKDWNEAYRAAFFVDKTVWNLEGLQLVFTFDTAARLSTDNQVTVLFSGLGLTIAQVVEQINEAAGRELAFAYPAASPTGLLIASPTYGTRSSLTFKAGASGNIGFGLPANQDVRIEASGFKAQDDGDGDQTSPWIEFFTGHWYLDGSSAEGSIPKAWGGLTVITGSAFDAEPYQLKADDVSGGEDELVLGSAPSVNFTTDIPLLAATASNPGDQFYGDGAHIKSGEVIKVETDRFKLGVLDSVNSTFDSSGEPTIRVYTAVEVETLTNTTPMAPRYAWFQAQGLLADDAASTAVAADLTSQDASPAQNAEVMSDVDVVTQEFPAGAGAGQFNLTGLDIKVRMTINGVEQAEQTFVFPAGAFDLATVAGRDAFLTAINAGFTGVVWSWTVVGGVAYYLTATMSDSGSADDILIISFDGTANEAFNFSRITPGSQGTGKDPEFGPADVADLGPTFDWSRLLALKIRQFTAGDVITGALSGATGTVVAGGNSQVVPYTPLPGPAFQDNEEITDGGGLSVGFVVGVDPNYLIIKQTAVGSLVDNGGGVTAVVRRVIDDSLNNVTYLGVESKAGGDFAASDQLQDVAGDNVAQLYAAWAGFGTYDVPHGLLLLPHDEMNLELHRVVYNEPVPTIYAVSVDFAPAEPAVGPTWTPGAQIVNSVGDLATVVAAFMFPNAGVAREGMVYLAAVQNPANWVNPVTLGPTGVEAAIAAGVGLQDFLPIPFDQAGGGAGGTVYNEVATLVNDLNTVTEVNGLQWLNGYLTFYDASENELVRLGARTAAAVGGQEIRLGVTNTPSRAGNINGNAIIPLADENLGWWDGLAVYGTGQWENAEIVGGALTFPLNIPVGEGMRLDVSGTAAMWYNNSGGPLVYANMTELLVGTSGASDGLNSVNLPGGGANPWATAVTILPGQDDSGNPILVVRTQATGFTESLEALAYAAPAVAEGWGTIGFSVGAQGFGTSAISGKRIRFQFDHSPRVFDTVAPSNSLLEIIEAINSDAGFTVASRGGSTNEALKLTSPLAGVASTVQMLDADTTEDAWNTDPTTYPGAFAAWRLGMTTLQSNDESVGSGRPFPDAWVGDTAGELNISAEIHRHPVTGWPLWPAVSDQYIQYRGHRLDVSPDAADPGLLVFDSPDDITDALSPTTTQNPLGLGAFLTSLNAPGIQTSALGVTEVSAAAEEGTLTGFADAFDFLEKEEIYGLSLLTHLETVHQAGVTHVDDMSQPEKKGERIVIFNPLVPTHANSTLVASGTNGETQTGFSDRFVMDQDPAAALSAAGLNPALPFTEDDGVYLEITVSGELRRYLLSSVNGPIGFFNLGPFANVDSSGFYTTTPLTETLTGADWSLFIRGAELVLPGTTKPDLNGIATAVAGAASAYKNRRAFYLFPDRAKTNLTGTEIEVEGYYLCAAVAGMVGQLPPQQGFTNYPITGFTGIIGSNEKFREDQLDVIAGGGVYIIKQDVAGAPLSCRHQLSTDVSSIEKRELSITKAVDYTAKFLRTGLRGFIGTYNITPSLLDILSTVVQGHLEFLSTSGIIASGELNNIIQDETQPDRVLIDVTLEVLFPCNYIRLTLVI